MTANIFNPCITQEECGHWWNEDIWAGLCNNLRNDTSTNWYRDDVPMFNLAKLMNLDPMGQSEAGGVKQELG